MNEAEKKAADKAAADKIDAEKAKQQQQARQPQQPTPAARPTAVPRTDARLATAATAPGPRPRPGDGRHPADVGVGDEVAVVVATGEHCTAEVTDVRDDDSGFVDLTFTFRGEPVTLTNSPHDETGRRHDSWHVPPATLPALAAHPRAADKTPPLDITGRPVRVPPGGSLTGA